MVAPKGLGRSPYKICKLNLSSLKANKNLEFLRINLEFLEIASVALLPRNDAGNSRIPYRDPLKRLGDDTKSKAGDDIVTNSKIPKPFVIPRLDHMISSQRILEFPRGFLRL